jgi:hypothetical protein
MVTAFGWSIMSAIPPKADIPRRNLNVSFGHWVGEAKMP